MVFRMLSTATPHFRTINFSLIIPYYAQNYNPFRRIKSTEFGSGRYLAVGAISYNIDAEKKEAMQAQKSAAFHRAFTKADLCEYYVNLEANTLIPLRLNRPDDSL